MTKDIKLSKEFPLTRFNMDLAPPSPSVHATPSPLFTKLLSILVDWTLIIPSYQTNSPIER